MIDWFLGIFKWVLVAVVVVLLIVICGFVRSFWEKFLELMEKLWELSEPLVEVRKKFGGFGGWIKRNYKLIMLVVAVLMLLVAVATLVWGVYGGRGQGIRI